MIAGGQEVIIGAVTDPSFGKLVAFGLGGVLVEVLKDVTFRLAPASHDDALSMLDSIEAAEHPEGRARRRSVSTARRWRRSSRTSSQLVADFPEIAEMDLNPVFASKGGAIAADVRIVHRLESRRRRATAPSQAEILHAMNRIMRPEAVAVIGASGEDGKIGNSVMKNLINGGYQRQDLSDPSESRGDPRAQGLQIGEGRARRRSTSPSSPSPPNSWRRRCVECGEKKIPAPS